MSALETAVEPQAVNKALVLAAVCLAGIMMPLSFTGPSVALPAIGRSFGAGTLELNWVMNAFILAFGSAVMAAGTLADRYGRKRMFTIGITAFGILSLVVGLAPSILALDLLRAAQGIAAALGMAGGAASLAHEFEGPARTRAYSLLGTSFGIGLAFGPILCGYLVESFGWRSIFFAGAAMSVVVIVFGVPRMHESRDPNATGIDPWGTLTFTAMLLLLTFGIVQGPQDGWSSPRVLGLLIGAAAMLGIFIQVERMQRRPMLDLSLFRYPRFLGVQSLPVATAYGFVVPLVFLPVRFIGIEGMDTVQVGLMMLPLCVPMAIVPFLGGLLTRWFSAGLLSSLGLVVSAGGLLWLSTVPTGAGFLDFALPMLAIGIGSGLPWGLMDSLAVSVVPKERAGMATGIFATMRVAGEAVALAVVGSILLGLTQGGLAGLDGIELPVGALANEVAGGNLDRATALAPQLGGGALLGVYASAFRWTFVVLSAITLAAAVVAFATLRRPHHLPAKRIETCEA